jgi:hypothetical protein
MRDCPRGDDPLTTGQRNEVMVLECLATNGTFTFSFGGDTTPVSERKAKVRVSCDISTKSKSIVR